MCRFWSGYATADGKFHDAYPFDSHSGVKNKPEDAVPVEANFDDEKLVFYDHALPSWWTDALTESLSAHILKRQEDILSMRTTLEARREREKQLLALRKRVKNKESRRRIVELAGHGDVLTALHHIEHVHTERVIRRTFTDQLDDIRLKAVKAWLAKKATDDYLKCLLKKAQAGCSARTLSVKDVRRAVDNFVETGERQSVGGWSVARAYYKYGAPYGTFAVISNAVPPIRVYRGRV